MRRPDAGSNASTGGSWLSPTSWTASQPKNEEGLAGHVAHPFQAANATPPRESGIKGWGPSSMHRSYSPTSLAALAACGAFLAAVPSRADEGMWTFDNPPLKQLQEKYRFTPSQEWLPHVCLSS